MSSLHKMGRKHLRLGMLLALTAIALPQGQLSAIATPLEATPQYAQVPSDSMTRPLPQVVANRVLADASQQLGIPRAGLQIQRYTRERWSDSCLGLGGPHESCALMVTPGWQVEVSYERDGEQGSLFYHTDLVGRTIRSSTEAQLPPSVSDRLLQHAANASGVAVSELMITSAEPKFWDGCLGIYAPNQMCTQIGIWGWRAIVSSPTQSWVYHTNATGSDIRLNTVATVTGIIPRLIASTSGQLFPEMVFRVIRSGGFAGLRTEVLLLSDGEVIQVPPHADGSSTPYLLNQLSPQEVQQFVEFLEQHQFQNFSGLSYPPAPGAADYFTVTLTSRSGTTQYADIVQEQLPSELQQIIQAWEGLQQGE